MLTGEPERIAEMVHDRGVAYGLGYFSVLGAVPEDLAEVLAA